MCRTAVAGARSLINRDRGSHTDTASYISLAGGGRTMYIPDWSRVGPASSIARGIRQPCNRINTPSSRNAHAEQVTRASALLEDVVTAVDISLRYTWGTGLYHTTGAIVPSTHERTYARCTYSRGRSPRSRGVERYRKHFLFLFCTRSLAVDRPRHALLGRERFQATNNRLAQSYTSVEFRISIPDRPGPYSKYWPTP